MKQKGSFLILLLAVIVVLILIMLDFKGITPNITEYKAFVDLNSGDTRYQRFIFSLKVKDKIRKTLFSEEVRRLGIDIPNERIWKFKSGKYFRFSSTKISDGYSIVTPKLNKLLLVFKVYNIPDNERIVIIKEVLECWKTIEPNKVYKALDDIIDKYENKYKEKTH